MNSALKGIVAGVMMAGISTVLTFRLGKRVPDNKAGMRPILTPEQQLEQLERLGVDEATALEDACKIEHDISDASFEAIRRFLKKQ